MRKLELLAPARNLTCGIAAIDHGADAVYIGAHRFGARSAAGNSIEDIQQLCQYAHSFDAKVYVTVNTILYEEELEDTRQLFSALRSVGVDAILVQDMGVLKLHPELPLHASTQTDNRTAEKVAWLQSLGFSRVVLARELSISEIAAIHREVPNVELEVFVHGALCVSYSGLCYASQYCFGRSANRGECAQFCRMKFDLLDTDDNILEHDRYLLSLKDMNQLANLERLADAGACSFKIEGRLKDVDYVKNVTAAYSERLNQLVKAYPDKYTRASRGRSQVSFTPDLQKTFNRGYTTYFAEGRQKNMASFETPKAMGAYVGYVKAIREQSITVAGTAVFSNGDGLCFVNNKRELEGFRVNRVENNRLFPQRIPANLRMGTRLYRNNDQGFERTLSKSSAERKIPVSMRLKAIPEGLQLSVDGVDVQIAMKHQIAQKPQHENIVQQLSKLGGTPYECMQVVLDDDFNLFVPNSVLGDLRRKALAALQERSAVREHEVCKQDASFTHSVPIYQHSFLYNVSNSLSRQFYQEHEVKEVADAFEIHQPSRPLIMQCRYCLRHELGFCVRHGGHRPMWKEPLFLRLGDGRRFQLEFDCSHCQMNIYALHS